VIMRCSWGFISKNSSGEERAGAWGTSNVAKRVLMLVLEMDVGHRQGCFSFVTAWVVSLAYRDHIVYVGKTGTGCDNERV